MKKRTYTHLQLIELLIFYNSFCSPELCSRFLSSSFPKQFVELNKFVQTFFQEILHIFNSTRRN
jgi:hypothetical protein